MYKCSYFKVLWQLDNLEVPSILIIWKCPSILNGKWGVINLYLQPTTKKHLGARLKTWNPKLVYCVWCGRPENRELHYSFELRNSQSPFDFNLYCFRASTINNAHTHDMTGGWMVGVGVPKKNDLNAKMPSARLNINILLIIYLYT